MNENKTPFTVKEKTEVKVNKGYSTYFEKEFGSILEELKPKQMTFDMFPRVLRKNIMTMLAFSLLFLVIAITIMISSGFNQWKILIILLFLIIYFIMGTISLFKVGSSQSYYEFKGVITVVSKHTINPFKKEQEYTIQITDFETNKTIAFDYRGNESPKRGMPATVYLTEGTKVHSDSDYGPFVDNYLGVSFHMSTKEIEKSFDKKENVNIEDYVRK